MKSSLSDLFYKGTSLIRIFALSRSVSVLQRFDCKSFFPASCFEEELYDITRLKDFRKRGSPVTCRDLRCVASSR